MLRTDRPLSSASCSIVSEFSPGSSGTALSSRRSGSAGCPAWRAPRLGGSVRWPPSGVSSRRMRSCSPGRDCGSTRSGRSPPPAGRSRRRRPRRLRSRCSGPRRAPPACRSRDGPQGPPAGASRAAARGHRDDGARRSGRRAAPCGRAYSQPHRLRRAVCRARAPRARSASRGTQSRRARGRVRGRRDRLLHAPPPDPRSRH
jgi:hypothetical protein